MGLIGPMISTDGTEYAELVKSFARRGLGRKSQRYLQYYLAEYAACVQADSDTRNSYGTALIIYVRFNY